MTCACSNSNSNKLIEHSVENFIFGYRERIRREDIIVSAARDGRIPWVSVDDIADVAFAALTDEESHNKDHIIVGPELLSYDEVSYSVSLTPRVSYDLSAADCDSTERSAGKKNNPQATEQRGIQAGLAGHWFRRGLCGNDDERRLEHRRRRRGEDFCSAGELCWA